MQLSVVIPARNEERLLGEQLEALLTQDWDGAWELIVVDNGSTDRTAQVVADFMARSPRVRYVEAADRGDQSYAANTGVVASQAPAVAFCDADDVVADGWLAAMADGLGRHQVVTGPNLLDRLNPPWLAGSRGRSAEDAVGSFHGIFPLVRGNNYGVRREVWDIVGPLAEEHFPVADQEFSLRCWLAGIDVVGLPGAAVHYRYRQDTRSLWRQGWAYGTHRPLIGRLLRESGRGRPPRFAGWRSWVLLVARLPSIRTRQGRALWVWLAANRFGQLVGSLRHRTLMV